MATEPTKGHEIFYFNAKTLRRYFFAASICSGSTKKIKKQNGSTFILAHYKIKYWLPLLILSLLPACGYYNPNTVKDKSGKRFTVYAPQWKNQTNELGLESIMNHAVHDWLSESKTVKLASSPANADYLLNGIILSINIPGLSYDIFDQATEVRAELKVHYTLKEKKTGNAIFSKNTIQRQAFRVGPDAPHTNTNKDKALKTIADRIGEQVHMNTFYALTKNKLFK